MTGQPGIGRFALVLHTHLPWLAHHGSWPVGEEWLHQAWGTSYLRVFDVLDRLAQRGHTGVLTLGVTPVLAAQWDDPHMMREQHRWLTDWHLRAFGMTADRDPDRRAAGRREAAAATQALHLFDRSWSSGGSPALRRLVDSGVIELLGGPLTHSFTPLLPRRLATETLRSGLDDTALRVGHRPAGIWTPECAYSPGLEEVFHRAGAAHLMLDGPTLQGVGAGTDRAWWLGDSDVAVVARDLEVTYRVWSPRRGYPGDRWYRDFHSFDHEWGFRTQRVTGKSVAAHEKAPYDPVRASASVERDARDFVDVVRRRLLDRARTDEVANPLVVAAFDTELFGHWWHEGPEWLERIFTLLPEAGVDVVTLSQAVDNPAGRVYPEAGSWGLHKDWHIWTGPADIAARQEALTKDTLAVLDSTTPRGYRSQSHDQLVRELLLALSSDWAFMVSHDSAADYARTRFHDHAERAHGILNALATPLATSDRPDLAEARSLDAKSRDYPFGFLDARRFLDRHGFEVG